jgi:hypothetical protein
MLAMLNCLGYSEFINKATQGYKMVLVRCDYINGSGLFDKQFKNLSSAKKWINQFGTSLLYKNFMIITL